MKSDRDILLNKKKLPGDDYRRDARLNAEFMDVVLLNNVEFRRFRSKEGNGDEYECCWEIVDGDDLRSDEAAFVQQNFYTQGFDLHVPEGEEAINVLVLATIPTLTFDSYGGDCSNGHCMALRVDNKMQMISHISQDTGHYYHLNTVVRVKRNSKLDFCNCCKDSNNN